jgi:hypothetical protein
VFAIDIQQGVKKKLSKLFNDPAAMLPLRVPNLKPGLPLRLIDQRNRIIWQGP